MSSTSTVIYSTAMSIATLITSIGLSFPQGESSSPRTGFLATAKSIMETVSDAPKFADGRDLLIPGTARIGETRIHYPDNSHYITEELCPTNQAAGITYRTAGQFMYLQGNARASGTVDDVPVTVLADGRVVHTGLLPSNFISVNISGAQKVTVKSDDPRFCMHVSQFKRWY